MIANFITTLNSPTKNLKKIIKNKIAKNIYINSKFITSWIHYIE